MRVTGSKKKMFFKRDSSHTDRKPSGRAESLAWTLNLPDQGGWGPQLMKGPWMDTERVMELKVRK